MSPIRRLTRKLRRRFIPTVIVSADIVSAIIASTIIASVWRTPRHRDSGATRAIGKAFGPRITAQPDIRDKVAESLARCLLPWFETRRYATLLTMRSGVWRARASRMRAVVVAIRNATTRADAATISVRDLRDVRLPQSKKSRALFQSGCGQPNGSHGLQPSRPQSVCNFALAGDAYSVSSGTVRSPQVAPWLSAEPSSHNAYLSPDAQAASLIIPTVIVLAICLSHGAHRAIATMPDRRSGRDPRNRQSLWRAGCRRTRPRPRGR